MLNVSPRFTLVAALLIAVLLGGCNLRQGNTTNTPFPTPDIPQVRFMFPDNNSSVIEGTDLAVQLLAEDLGAGIARVELLVDDVSQGEGKPEVAPAVPAFSANIHWIATGVGLHSLTAIAYRPDGQASAPATLVLNVIARPTETP
ncbi:MAG: hypothetical protein LCI00_29600 [Chloroflexi bacterium]|nr:hypothetical protein [Chloroflexota bacterium]MCC6893374.1 hypothetical protein [Anaerolineae bacterium]